MKTQLYKQFIHEIAGIAATVGVLAGSGLGAYLNQLYNNSKKRAMSCEYITNPILQDKCKVKILDSLISNLKHSRGECDNTPDPAQCNLDLMKKIDKLTTQKLKLIKQIDYEIRSQMIDNEEI